MHKNLSSKITSLKVLIYIVILLLSETVFAFDFAIIGDRTSNPNAQVFKNIIKRIALMHPHFAINVGDLIEDRNISEWDGVLKDLKIIEAPLFFTPGNNDIGDQYTIKVFTEKTGCAPYYSFDYQEAHFIVLNNATARSSFQMDDTQIAWLKTDLQANSNKATLIFMHKPFWTAEIAENQPDKLHPIFKSANVKAVFTGHIHVPIYKVIDNIEYFSVGSSGGITVPEDVTRGYFFQFFWGRFTNNELTINVVNSNGEFFPKELIKPQED